MGVSCGGAAIYLSSIHFKLLKGYEKLITGEAESIGWSPLGEGAYLCVADEESAGVLILGLSRAEMQAFKVLWVV